MKAGGKVTMELLIQGDTGYNNCSDMLLVLPAGELKLPKKSWDLSGIEDEVLQTKKIILGIPSGYLEVNVNQVVKNTSWWNSKDTVFTFSGTFEWDGKQAGLYGGMSGYANFKVDEVVVYSSVYLHPKEYGVDIATIHHRQAIHHQILGREAALAEAAQVAIGKEEGGDMYPSNTWFKKLLEFDKTEIVESEPVTTLSIREKRAARKAALATLPSDFESEEYEDLEECEYLKD